jgi:hypothetical protein
VLVHESPVTTGESEPGTELSVQLGLDEEASVVVHTLDVLVPIQKLVVAHESSLNVAGSELDDHVGAVGGTCTTFDFRFPSAS